VHTHIKILFTKMFKCGGMVETVYSKIRSNGFDGGVKCRAKVMAVVFGGVNVTIRGMTII